jgi:D-amino peptidase
MHVLIAADMEGITGVVNWDQVTPGQSEYERFRLLMTEDVNAAVRGAYEAGAEQVIITDGHSGGTNILLEKLDPRGVLNCGSPSPYSMVQGVDSTEGVLFVGYHARAGTPNAILDHTWSSRCVRNVWLNGVLVGEYGLNAAVAGYWNVPVIMISGDQTACAQAVELLGELECAVVKQASGRFSAECLSPKNAQETIQKASCAAVTKLKRGKEPKPYRVEKPVTLMVEFSTSDMADQVMWMPRAERQGTRISVVVDDMPEAYHLFRGMVALAAT